MPRPVRGLSFQAWTLIVLALLIVVVATILAIPRSPRSGSTSTRPSAAVVAPRASGQVKHAKAPITAAHGSGAKPSAASPAAGAAAVTAGGVSPSALRVPRRRTGAVRRWKAGPGGTALAALTTELGVTAQAGGVKLYTTMRQDCAALATDISAARAAPVIPVAAMQRTYGRALAELSSAAGKCQAGITSRPQGDENTQTNVNGTMLQKADAALAAGARQLYLATQPIRDLRR